MQDYTGDLNNLTTSGFYMTDSTATNTPHSACWYVFVQSKNSNYYVVQLAIKRDESNTEIYARKRYSGWGNWEKIASNVGKNYYSTVTIDSSLIEPNPNLQAITKNGNLVCINTTFYTKVPFSANTFYDIMTLPTDYINPSGNQVGMAFSTSSNVTGFWYYQSFSRKIRVKFVSALPSGAEISLMGTYSLI